jgi:hypothetical protein
VIKRKFCDGQHSGAGDYGSYLSPEGCSSDGAGPMNKERAVNYNDNGSQSAPRLDASGPTNNELEQVVLHSLLKALCKQVTGGGLNSRGCRQNPLNKTRGFA